MSARHGVTATKRIRKRKSVAATKEFRQREGVAATKEFRQEKECVLRRRIYRKYRLVGGSKT